MRMRLSKGDELAEAWLNDALMEHASIASFAKFTLDLLAIGAPAELVHDAQQASIDEVHHARLCFALASRFAGRSLGPGSLPTATQSSQGSSGPHQLGDIVRAAFREGCVGETIAALVASEQRDGCTDQQAVDALSIIARDEAQHAALAWRFIAWALGQDRAAVLPVLQQERIALLSGQRTPPATKSSVSDHAWRAAGRLAPGEHAEVTRLAVEQVVIPCLDALTAAAPASVVAAYAETRVALSMS